MRLEFVNHSSVILESGEMRLICDPWLEGTAFHDGWALLSPTALDYSDFRTITHIWFSHEHPDHFSPATLRKIPESERQRITVLFQKTRDGKVARFCRDLGFQVEELEADTIYRPAPGIEMTCRPWPGFEDSWCYIKTPEGSVLNVNDCPINQRLQAEQLKRQIGPVDVLLTQFSISAWDGNREELQRRRAGAHAMLSRTVMHSNVFEARHVVPFASYIWFCHDENRYMNDGFIGMEEVYQTLCRETQTTPLVMYPGDCWESGKPFDSKAAVKRYAKDQASLAKRPTFVAETVSAQELVEASRSYCEMVARDSSALRTRIHLARREFQRWSVDPGSTPFLTALWRALRLHAEPARIFVPDLQQAYSFDLFRGLRAMPWSEAECEIAIGSEALLYSFRFLWGGETLLFNGRFREIIPGGRSRLFHLYSLAGERNAGKTISWSSAPGDLMRFVRGPDSDDQDQEAA